MRVLEAGGDVIILEVEQLFGEAVDVGGDPGGGVVVPGGGVLHDAGGHQPPVRPVLLVNAVENEYFVWYGI